MQTHVGKLLHTLCHEWPKKGIIAPFLIAGLIASCTAPGTNWQPDESKRLNLLILSENERPSIRRVYERVDNALTREMLDAGFNVYEEAAIAHSTSKRSDEETLAIARSVKSVPIDVLVAFTVHAISESRAQVRKLRLRVAARMVNVATGQWLGHYESEYTSLITIPNDCDRDCELEKIGEEAHLLAHEIGAALAKRLD